ncbi:hypothetical protein Goarm_002206 [Gossypium armourianum]|uniref:Uncharacterized protein n=1 Tax=Gossypium armourianum TaxID=34283 RepID=A0A7J9K7Y5_9ROSI|nr:hypothetical protein [Gossypium armourianum]
MGNAEAKKRSFYRTNSTNTSSASQISGVKEAHAVSPKFAQIMYFSLISLFLRLLYISQQNVRFGRSAGNMNPWSKGSYGR